MLTPRGARQVGGFARFVAPFAASSAQAFGLFTERDLLKVLAAGPRDLRSVPVNEYMTSAADMIWADADFPVKLKSLATLHLDNNKIAEPAAPRSPPPCCEPARVTVTGACLPFA